MTPSLQVKKQELVRDTLWAAAIDLFAEKGFEETTVEDIVAAAGTSRRTFFRHFATKRDLMAQPVLSVGATLAQAIADVPEGASPAEAFRHVVMAACQRSAADPRTRKLMEIAARYPAAREAQVSRAAEVQDQVADAFARRYPDGLTAHLLAGLTLAALSLAHRVWYAGGCGAMEPAVRQVLGQFAEVANGPGRQQF